MPDMVMSQYLRKIVAHLEKLHDEEADAVQKVARLVDNHVKQDQLDEM